MNQQLIDAYLNTTYCVSDPLINIRIGKACPELGALLAKHQLTCRTFITAFYPYSEIKSLEENQAQNERLLKDLAFYLVYKGLGISVDDLWQSEESYLFLGISKEDPIKTGNT